MHEKINVWNKNKTALFLHACFLKFEIIENDWSVHYLVYSYQFFVALCVSAWFRWWGVWGPGVVGSSIESLGRGLSTKSLVFPHIINIYDVILWRHLCLLNCNSVGAGKLCGVRRIFSRILANLPEKKFHKKNWPQQKSSSCYFGRHFCSYFHCFAKIFRNFVKVFRDFAQISSGLPKFSPNQNFWRCACPPCTPTSHTSAQLSKLYDATRDLRRISD